MSKYKDNESVVNAFAAAYKKDKDVVQRYIHGLIDSGETILELGKVDQMWGGRSTMLGTVVEGYNNGFPTLDKLAHKPGGGKVWRKMSMGTFIKTFPKGTYLIKLEKEMILVRDRIAVVGDFNSKSRIVDAFKIQK